MVLSRNYVDGSKTIFETYVLLLDMPCLILLCRLELVRGLFPNVFQADASGAEPFLDSSRCPGPGLKPVSHLMEMSNSDADCGL